jgi:hypothetical protein
LEEEMVSVEAEALVELVLLEKEDLEKAVLELMEAVSLVELVLLEEETVLEEMVLLEAGALAQQVLRVEEAQTENQDWLEGDL